MKKIMTKKSVLAAVFITGAAVLIFVLFGNNNILTSAVKTFFSPVLTVTSEISYKVGSFKDYLLEMQVYREENDKLSSQLNSLKRESRDVSELVEENERLKALLDLKSNLEYDTVAAVVVSYEPNNWYDTIVINKGSNDGIKQGSAVISEKGIVGKVTQTGLGWSRISSVLNDETAVGVKVIRNGALAVLEGDTKLSKEKLCRMSFFGDGIDLLQGDMIETMGTAGLYPEGIPVGTIIKLQKDSDGREYAVVEPVVDFDNLYEVLVVTGVMEG